MSREGRFRLRGGGVDGPVGVRFFELISKSDPREFLGVLLTGKDDKEGEGEGLGALLLFLGLTSLGEETIGEEIFLFSEVAKAENSVC